MAMKQETVKVWEFLKNHVNENLTAADVAGSLGLPKKQVDGIFTMAIQRKGCGVREEAEAVQADGTHKKIKFLRLNDNGVNFDLQAAQEEN